MKKTELEIFVETLCADEFEVLRDLMEEKSDVILESKISNHLIIQRERKSSASFTCPNCKSNNIVKNGHTRDGNQKYHCKSCNTYPSDATNSIVFKSKKPYIKWIKVIRATLAGDPLRKTAEELDLNKNTVFAWRHKILRTLSNYAKSIDDNLEGFIEMDGTFFSINLKGTKPKNMPRRSKKRRSSGKKGLSNHKVCVMVAVDEYDQLLIEVAGLGPESREMLLQFKNRFKEGSNLITDSKSSFIEFAQKCQMSLEQIPSGFRETENHNNLATVNGIHAQIKLFLDRYKGVSIRHLQGYLDLFRFKKILKYKFGYKGMDYKLAKESLPYEVSLFIKDIYKKEIPIDLKKAYGEYGYGIYAS